MAIKQNEKAGRSNDYYQLVLNSIDDYAVFTTDKQGLVNSWNSGAEQVLGYKAEDILGMDAAVFFTAGDLRQSADKKEMRQARKHGSAIDERYHVRKDQSVFWASGKMFPLFDTAGKHLGFTKVMRNLDDRKRAEEQLAQLRNYAEAIVSNSRQPILVLTSELAIFTANRPFYQLFKFSRKSADARELFNIPELGELLGQLVRSGKPIENFQLEHDWPAIGKKYFIINASKLQHQTNSENLLLFSIEDITANKALEKQKDDFISTASHEIRTPVTVIKAYVQILQKRATAVNDQFLAVTAGKVNEKTEKLMTMVSYLLDASQLELGELIIKKTGFDLTALISESVSELELIDKHRFIVKSEKIGEVIGDRIRISQVLNNLLNNAIKYSPVDLPVTVTVRKNKKGDLVTVRVKDLGIGIPKSEQVHLFKRFWRASSATSRNISGIGLGLHISQAIIKQHGGRLWLKSEIEKGSVFSFSLPVGNV